MFDSCTSLTAPPELPAKTLAPLCYYQMFIGCTSIMLNTEEPGIAWSIPADADATGATQWNTNMFAETSGNFTGAPEIGTTYYLPEYDLWICGEQVTAANKDDLRGTFANGTVTGNNVSYNPETNTLTLDGATISSSGDYGAIATHIDGLKIDVIGTNTITTTTNQEGIRFYGTSSNNIEGSGSLTINAPNYEAIRSSDTLVIKNCTIAATGYLCGISGGNGGDKLIIDNATVSATGTIFGSIYSFKDIELIGCAIVKPSDAEFNPSQRAICAADTIVKTEVKIIPAYDLWVCGEQVTVANKNDLRGTFAGGTVTGNNVSYNPETNTLTLDGATISSSSSDGYGSGITIKINGLKIEVIGANTVTSTANVPGIGIIETSSNSIEGNGTLMVSALNDCEALFVHTVDTLTIKYCKLTAIGSDCGIYGVVAKQLIIDNATVSATGTNYGSISGFDDMELIGCAIVKPAGAVFNPDNDAVCYADGTVVKEEVKIKPTGTGVKNIGNQTVIIYPNPVQDILHIQAEGAVIAVRVYNIHGAVVAQALNNAREINLSHLPTGIYMVRVEVGENVGAMRIIKN